MTGRNRGFTKVELLSVILIISIFISLLLPAISNTIKVAQRVHCQNNLRQLGLAMLFYVEDWGGYFPERASWGWTGARWHYGGMPASVGDYFAYGPEVIKTRIEIPLRPPWFGGRGGDDSWNWTDRETWPAGKAEKTTTNVTPETLHAAVFTLEGDEKGQAVGDMDRNGDGFEDERPLNQYLNGEFRVFRCPAERLIGGIPGYRYPRGYRTDDINGVGTDYALNVDTWKSGTRSLSGVRLEDVVRQTKTVMFFENPGIGALAGWPVTETGERTLFGRSWPSEELAYSWHDSKRNMINVFFLDGHVEYIDITSGAVRGLDYSFDVELAE